MAKTVTLRISDDRYRLFREVAEAQERPISKYVELAAWKHTLESGFVSDEETREILGNKRLTRSLKRGSWEAHHRQGRFVHA